MAIKLNIISIYVADALNKTIKHLISLIIVGKT